MLKPCPSILTAAQKRTYTNRIIDTYRQATEDQQRRGLNWYHHIHDIAAEMADGDVDKGAGVIAALSPNQAWDINLRNARTAFATGLCFGTDDMTRKARAILEGTPAAEVLPMHLKTGHFYRCIADPDDPGPVAIDRHAHDIAYGHRLGQMPRNLKGQRYASLVGVYQAAARRLGLVPSAVQAVTWVVWTEEGAGTDRRPVTSRYHAALV